MRRDNTSGLSRWTSPSTLKKASQLRCRHSSLKRTSNQTTTPTCHFHKTVKNMPIDATVCHQRFRSANGHLICLENMSKWPQSPDAQHCFREKKSLMMKILTRSSGKSQPIKNSCLDLTSNKTLLTRLSCEHAILWCFHCWRRTWWSGTLKSSVQPPSCPVIFHEVLPEKNNGSQITGLYLHKILEVLKSTVKVRSYSTWSLKYWPELRFQTCDKEIIW